MRDASTGAPLVITGCGTINALGPNVPTFWNALLRAETGVRPLERGFAARTDFLAATVEDPLPSVAGSGPALSRTDQLAIVAAEEALRAAQLPRGPDERQRVAIVVGTTTGGIREVSLAFAATGSLARAQRAQILLYETATTAEALARRLGALGPRLTIHTACASGASAVLLGAELIHAEEADIVLAGGADSLAHITLAGFRALRALDRSPCRPFDRNRRGLSLGEGAGFVVLERPESAAARGAVPVARLLGAAQTTDAHHLTAPLQDGSGAARALLLAMERSGIHPEEVDHINAHGTGTPANDAAEAAAIRAALGPHASTCPITSIKGAIGHTLGAAGAIEAIAALWTLKSGLVPPTVGLSQPDESFGLDFVRDAPREGDWRVVLSNSFGFGGSNAVLCLGRGTR